MEKAKISIEKLDPKSKKSQKSKFSEFFPLPFPTLKNYFKYRNARSHRPVLETEERIQKFVDTEENEPTKVAKKNS